MDFAGLFALFVAVVCVSTAQKQNQNRLRAQERPVNQQYRYGSRLGNLGSGLPHQRNSLYKQPYGRGYDRARFQSGSRYNSINGRALGYGNYLRQMGRGYAQSRPALRNPLYRAPARFSSSYKTGYPLPAPYPGYSPNYAPLPVQAPSLYGYDNYQVDRWGAWSSWSACSRSCDGGVQERTRKCKTSKLAMTLSLYKGQGQHGNCPGFGKEFQPCNTSPCVSVKSYEDQKYEARKNQCSKFDKKDYLGQRYTWMPYIRDGLNECRLYCMAKGFRMFVELAKSVVDGTICGKLGASACYNGTCSRKRPNVEIKAAKSEDKNPVTKPVVVDALVKPSNEKTPFQLAQNRNFLTLGGRNALQSYRSAAVDYHKKRPGPQQQQPYQRYNKKISPGLRNIKPQVKSNRLVTRKVSGMFNSKAGLKLGYNEIFKIPTGATHIRIQEARPSENYLALKVDDKYLVNGRWSIVLKKDIRAAGTLIKYRLNRGPKSTEVITAAGPTSKELKIVLLYQEGPPEIFFNYTIKLPKSRSNHIPKTAASLRRNSDNRARTKPTLHWSVAGWTKCSQRCGGGEQQLNIKCVAVYPGRKTTVVKSSYCHSLKKPNQRRRMCNMLPCKPSWKLLPWQPCNKKCGYGGFQQRDVRCIRVILTREGKVEINAPFYTCGRRPAIRKDCPYVPCYAWKSDPWSACSRTCDKGTQSRRIFCVTNDKIRDDSHCDLRKKPDSFQMCNLRPCRADWFIGKWNKCAKFCGEGRQTRLVFCAGKDGASLPELYCKHQKQPSQSRVCINEKCNGIWLASNWTQCSTSCGVGERSRIVLCFGMQNGSMRQISEYLCDYHTKPNPKEICNLAKCQPEWYTTEWGQCSATCGRGIKARQINCMMKDGKQGRGCQIETRPNAAMICKTKPCENEVDNHQVVESSFVKVVTKSSEEKREAVTTQPLINKIFTTHRSREGLVGHLKTTKLPKFAKASASASKNILKVFSKNQVKMFPRSENQEGYWSSKTENNKTPTTKPLVLTTKPKKKIVKAICKNTHKKAYCAVILRIGFCKFTTYRNRCCTSCSGKSR